MTRIVSAIIGPEGISTLRTLEPFAADLVTNVNELFEKFPCIMGGAAMRACADTDGNREPVCRIEPPIPYDGYGRVALGCLAQHLCAATYDRVEAIDVRPDTPRPDRFRVLATRPSEPREPGGVNYDELQLDGDDWSLNAMGATPI